VALFYKAKGMYSITRVARATLQNLLNDIFTGGLQHTGHVAGYTKSPSGIILLAISAPVPALGGRDNVMLGERDPVWTDVWVPNARNILVD
jgi:hypothetical protein